ncbi:protein CDV3 homolog [Watersipora subatra]|uniref:protein CDV3 homolog n=1 Tax=Watersipora subatra TaxID=2589382 RepID=UPI00355BABA4
MGDTDSLDDFFAKKDKKKKKSKGSRIIPTDLLPGTPPNEPNENVDQIGDQLADTKIDASSIDDASKERKKQRKKKDKDGSDPSQRKEEDEWNLVNDEVDYSGLRIASKNIAKEAAEEAAESAKQEPTYDEDGQVIEKGSDVRVWKINPVEPAPVEPPPPPAPIPDLEKMPNVSSDGKYVPPSRRGAAAAQLAPVSVKKTQRKRVAPNMNSQEDFPTLGAAPPPVDYDVSKFERVRGGATSNQQQPSVEQTRLQTSNMYSALERS